VAGFPEELRAAAGKRLQVGEIIGTGPGYFKLARGAQPARPGGIVDAAGAPGASIRLGLMRCQGLHQRLHLLWLRRVQRRCKPAPVTTLGSASRTARWRSVGTRARPSLSPTPILACACQAPWAGGYPILYRGARRGAGERVLVVSFSSAPGVPNWGSALRRVAKAADDPAHACFDVLFVVDTGRGWYSGAARAARAAACTTCRATAARLGDACPQACISHRTHPHARVPTRLAVPRPMRRTAGRRRGRTAPYSLREAFACPRGARARHVCKLACSPRACAGGDQGFTAWHERLALATRRYSKVMMVGDSMVRPLLCTA